MEAYWCPGPRLQEEDAQEYRRQVISTRLLGGSQRKLTEPLLHRFMPYAIRKVPGKKCFKVVNKDTGRVLAKCTSKEKAEKQIAYLHSVEGNVMG